MARQASGSPAASLWTAGADEIRVVAPGHSAANQDNAGAEEPVDRHLDRARVPEAQLVGGEHERGAIGRSYAEQEHELRDEEAAEYGAERRGSLAVVEGRAVLAKVEVDIPDTVQGTILARVDRLDLRTRSVLQHAAVLGRGSTTELLEAVVGDGAVSDELAALARAQLVLTPAPGEWSFKHALIQEVTYETCYFGTGASCTRRSLGRSSSVSPRRATWSASRSSGRRESGRRPPPIPLVWPSESTRVQRWRRPIARGRSHRHDPYHEEGVDPCAIGSTLVLIPLVGRRWPLDAGGRSRPCRCC